MSRHRLYRLGTMLYVLWVKVPTPRAISVITAIAYTSAVFTGVVTMVNPPLTYTVAAGDLALFLMSLFMLGGGLLGMVAGTFEFWQLERVAISAMMWALCAYAYVVLAIHFTEEGSRLTQFGVIAIALSFLAVRMAMIWRYPFKPRGAAQ